MRCCVVTTFFMVFFSGFVYSQTNYDYQLQPEKIAEDTYVVIGAKEDFSDRNGGNILNTGFIITTEGVVVIDSGPSYLYGQQLRKAIAEITDKPILKVLITHHHPDHIFGNQAFDDVPIYALPKTVELIETQAAGFLDNMYRMVGYWMKGTETAGNILPLSKEREQLGNHHLSYISHQGHTDSDLVIHDETTGVLFTGDLVFHNRALTTPHATPSDWQESLMSLRAIDFSVLVPGHGEIVTDMRAIEQTSAYLKWLESTIETGVNNGMDMNEVLSQPIPDEFQDLGVVEREYTRSVTHRFPFYENQFFD